MKKILLILLLICLGITIHAGPLDTFNIEFNTIVQNMRQNKITQQQAAYDIYSAREKLYNRGGIAFKRSPQLKSRIEQIKQKYTDFSTQWDAIEAGKREKTIKPEARKDTTTKTISTEPEKPTLRLTQETCYKSSITLQNHDIIEYINNEARRIHAAEGFWKRIGTTTYNIELSWDTLIADTFQIPGQPLLPGQKYALDKNNKLTPEYIQAITEFKEKLDTVLTRILRTTQPTNLIYTPTEDTHIIQQKINTFLIHTNIIQKSIQDPTKIMAPKTILCIQFNAQQKQTTRIVSTKITQPTTEHFNTAIKHAILSYFDPHYIQARVDEFVANRVTEITGKAVEQGEEDSLVILDIPRIVIDIAIEKKATETILNIICYPGVDQHLFYLEDTFKDTPSIWKKIGAITLGLLAIGNEAIPLSKSLVQKPNTTPKITDSTTAITSGGELIMTEPNICQTKNLEQIMQELTTQEIPQNERSALLESLRALATNTAITGPIAAITLSQDTAAHIIQGALAILPVPVQATPTEIQEIIESSAPLTIPQVNQAIRSIATAAITTIEPRPALTKKDITMYIQKAASKIPTEITPYAQIPGIRTDLLLDSIFYPPTINTKK